MRVETTVDSAAATSGSWRWAGKRIHSIATCGDGRVRSSTSKSQAVVHHPDSTAEDDADPEEEERGKMMNVAPTVGRHSFRPSKPNTMYMVDPNESWNKAGPCGGCSMRNVIQTMYKR